MKTAIDIDNRDKDAIIAHLEDRVAAMARKIVELMGEVQRAQRELTALEILYNEMVLDSKK